MVLQRLWVSQNFSQISQVSQSRFLAVTVCLAISFFIRSCLGVSIFRKAKGLEVPIHLSVSISDFFSSLDIEWSNFQIFKKKF